MWEMFMFATPVRIIKGALEYMIESLIFLGLGSILGLLVGSIFCLLMELV